MAHIVVIAASTGALGPLRRIVSALPATSAATIFIVMHIGAHESNLPEILSWSFDLPVSFAKDGASIEPSHVYVAPPDHHIILEPGRMHLSRSAKVHNARPAADPLFMSAAEAYRERVLGVVLSGGDSDGAEGLKVVKLHGGRTVVQLPDDAADPSMPQAAIARDHPDACLSVEKIARLVGALGHA
jgi:two-component system chemotaxis response regulator CheB